MKKNRNAAIAVCIALMLAINVSSRQHPSAPPPPSKEFTDYTWYKDEEMTDPTGTTSAIYIEIDRLEALFPGYTFSSTHSMGLYPYEWGDHFFYPTTIIYSNR